MKKFLFLSVFLLMSLLLLGCFSSGAKVEKVTMYVSDQVADATVEIIPDYKKRTLELTYKKDDLKAKKDEVATAGQVGGEYFDRFENLVKFVNEESKAVSNDAKTDKNQGILKIVVEKSDREAVQLETYWNDSLEGLEEVRALYLDITTMLTESEQV